MERPLCLLIDHILCVNVLCLLTAQVLSALLLDAPGVPMSVCWLIATVALMALHGAFGLLFAWIGGEESRIGGGAEFGDASGDGLSGDGSGGDGASSG
jgi:uncharacterized membrane protein